MAHLGQFQYLVVEAAYLPLSVVIVHYLIPEKAKGNNTKVNQTICYSVLSKAPSL